MTESFGKQLLDSLFCCVGNPCLTTMMYGPNVHYEGAEVETDINVLDGDIYVHFYFCPFIVHSVFIIIKISCPCTLLEILILHTFVFS